MIRNIYNTRLSIYLYKLRQKIIMNTKSIDKVYESNYYCLLLLLVFFISIQYYIRYIKVLTIYCILFFYMFTIVISHKDVVIVDQTLSVNLILSLYFPEFSGQYGLYLFYYQMFQARLTETNPNNSKDSNRLIFLISYILLLFYKSVMGVFK